MRKIIYTLFALIGFASFGFAQANMDIAVSKGKSELISSKTSGEYEFILPSTLTKETVNKNANYYTKMFTVNFDEKSHEAHLTMIGQDAQSRYVIGRFLTACGVGSVEIDGENVLLMDFMEGYLK